LNDFQFLSFAASPLALAAYAAIGIGALLAYRILGHQWKRPGFGKAVRTRELTALVAVALVGLALVAYAASQLRTRAAADALALERMQEKTDLAAQLRERISRELDAARALLADRTLQKIANEELVEARAELGRFASFQDPEINRMIELIDRELEIRKLVRQTLSEATPQNLGLIYARLTQLAPENAEYREKAALYPAGAAAAVKP